MSWRWNEANHSRRRMNWKSVVRDLIRRGGYDLGPYDASHPLRRRMGLVASRGITLLLDVGANTGQYATAMRRLGYRGRIVSFEPLEDAYAALRAASDADPAWSCEPFALGDRTEEATLHVAGNSQSSSLRDMLETHRRAAPESGFVDTRRVQVRKLDDLLPRLAAADDRIFLKVDTQGSERAVLEGARESLARVSLVQLECALQHLYEGDDLLSDLIVAMGGRGFSPVSIEEGFTDPSTFVQLQADVLFARTDSLR